MTDITVDRRIACECILLEKALQRDVMAGWTDTSVHSEA